MAKSRFSETEIKHIIDEYQQGFGISYLSRKYNIDNSSIRYWLKKMNVYVFQRQPFNFKIKEDIKIKKYPKIEEQSYASYVLKSTMSKQEKKIVLENYRLAKNGYIPDIYSLNL